MSCIAPVGIGTTPASQADDHEEPATQNRPNGSPSSRQRGESMPSVRRWIVDIESVTRRLHVPAAHDIELPADDPAGAAHVIVGAFPPRTPVVCDRIVAVEPADEWLVALTRVGPERPGTGAGEHPEFAVDDAGDAVGRHSRHVRLLGQAVGSGIVGPRVR